MLNNIQIRILLLGEKQFGDMKAERQKIARNLIQILENKQTVFDRYIISFHAFFSNEKYLS